MATYNGEMYLAEQIESIISQTYKKWILLIRDDMSTDNTMDVLNQYAKIDKRIRIIESVEKFGAKGNFDYLMQEALKINAEYIMFSDQDDIWETNKIERSLKCIKRAEEIFGKIPIMVYGNYEFIDEYSNHLGYANCENEFKGLEKKHTLFLQNPISGSTMIINNLLCKCAVNIPDVIDYHDRWVSLLAASCGEIVYLNEVVEKHRIHNNNATQRTDTSSLKNRIKRLIRFIKNPNAYWIYLTELYRQLDLRIKKCNLTPHDGLLEKYLRLLENRGLTGVIYILNEKFFMVYKKQTLFLLISMMVKNTTRNKC